MWKEEEEEAVGKWYCIVRTVLANLSFFLLSLLAILHYYVNSFFVLVLLDCFHAPLERVVK